MPGRVGSEGEEEVKGVSVVFAKKSSRRESPGLDCCPCKFLPISTVCICITVELSWTEASEVLPTVSLTKGTAVTEQL